jgi:hypothetical protein
MDRPHDDDLIRRLARDAERLPGASDAQLAERVLAALPERAPLAAAARRPRPLLPVLGLAAAALLSVWVLDLDDPAPGIDDASRATAAPTASAPEDFAPMVPEPRWVDVAWPGDRAPALPAVDGPPGPDGGAGALTRFLPMRPIDPLVAMERSVARSMDAAARRASDEAMAIFSAAAAPLLRLHGALSSAAPPR